jgi:hypothetical protein
MAVGTGITLYVAQDIGDIYNTSISLDGGPATNYFAYNDIKAQIEAYNATLYDIQGLNWITHSLRVELNGSRLLFDYAAVTGDQPPKKGAATTMASSPLLVFIPLSARVADSVPGGPQFWHLYWVCPSARGIRKIWG